MKKLHIILLLSVAIAAWGQEDINSPQKFALVIGNANYINFGALQNPVNDANDMEATLRSLGFTVDKVIDGSLSQMENATIRLRNRLSEAGNNSIGFFYYAGHGLEMGGVNYLIPTDANIPDRLYLRERAYSAQIMLDMLNEAKNGLNIVVLDACRDFPAAWSRSLNRGLAVVANPPANHIIMYATGAGTIANDGTGRNGFFTGYLLNNLKQPGIDVNEVFRRTMGDVARASNNEQRPALYTDFSDIVYLGSGPVAAKPVQPAQPTQERPSIPDEPAQEQPMLVQIPAGSRPPSTIPDNYRVNRDHRKKWVYVDFYFAYGNYKNAETSSFGEDFNSINSNIFGGGIQLDIIPLDYVFSNSFAIELAARTGYIVGGNSDGSAFQFPILGNIGLRYNRVGVSFNAGYSLGLTTGFTLGTTLGVQLYPGIIFIDFMSIPYEKKRLFDNFKADSAMFLTVGYKIGIGPYKERGYNKNK